MVRVEIPMSRSDNFNIEGIVFDQQTGLPLEGAVVELTSDTDENTPQRFIPSPCS